MPTPGRMANLKASFLQGHNQSRRNYRPDISEVSGADLTGRLAGGVHQAGRIAGKAHNLGQDRPLVAAGLGVGTLWLGSQFLGGNSTDAADSQVNPGPRSPNHTTPQMLDGKLKQRTLQRLNDNIQLNQIYIDALGNY